MIGNNLLLSQWLLSCGDELCSGLLFRHSIGLVDLLLLLLLLILGIHVTLDIVVVFDRKELWLLICVGGLGLLSKMIVEDLVLVARDSHGLVMGNVVLVVVQRVCRHCVWGDVAVEE